jgi:hypothetical protein
MAKGRPRIEIGTVESIECTVCKLDKIRIATGYFENGRTVFEDPEGKLWNGYTCGECNHKRIKIYRFNNRERYLEKLHKWLEKRKIQS